MMKKVGLSIMLAAFVLISSAQDVLTIADDNISLKEFKNVFYKNNHNADISEDYLNEYMELFVKFKLKVREAQELGLDTITSYVNELDGYRKQLAKPYLKNEEFDENMLTEAYERISFDVNASHILIAVDEKATDDEVKVAEQKAITIKKDIIDGKLSFGDAAKLNSDDKSAVSNMGKLGFFTAFMMVYDFETAAYNTKIGEISNPVRTKYGFHLIKVNDKRKAVGQVKVAHIMFKTGQGADENKLNQAKEKINKALQLLNKGEDFADVAERFSEDRSTAVKGGELPAFGVGKMVPEFENNAFELKSIGDISVPFRTEYGWHIIKLIAKEEMLSFDELKVELKRKIEKDSRGDLSKKALYEKLNDTYKVINKPAVYASFRKGAVNSVASATFEKVNNNQTLATIDGKSVSVNKFSEYILAYQSLGSDIDDMYIDFVNEELLAYEESKLEEKYPDYKALLQEYREGILLFDLTNKKVWAKAVEDTLGLQAFYDANKSNYTWEKRLDATIYSCIDLTTAKKVKREIYKKNRGTITNADILVKINKDDALSLQIESNKFVKGANKNVDAIKWKTGISKDIVLENGSYIIIDVHEVLESGAKEFSESRGKVISDYQTALENDWIASLKAKYAVTIHTEVLHSLVK
jgi:peptidyl-prolyl cis-trans isomerase SurA